MGEGAGEKDVSEQIEDEEQVLGTQNEAPAEAPENPLEEEDNGLEMANDFEGELYDREEKEEGEEGERDGNESEGEEPEEQMGKLDSDKAETLDKDMWGGPDKDEEGLDEEANETGGQETGETESAAKQDSSAPDPGKDKDKAAPTEEGEKKEEEGKEGEEGGAKEPEINNDYEEEGQNEPGEDDRQQQQQAQGGQPEEDERAPPEDLDLPDDLNLDGGMDDREDGAGPEGADEPPQPEGDVSGDEGEGAEEGKEEEFPEGAEQLQEQPHALPDDGAEMNAEEMDATQGEHSGDEAHPGEEEEGQEEKEEKEGEEEGAEADSHQPEAMDSRADEGEAGEGEDSREEDAGKDEKEEEEEGGAMETDGTTAQEDPAGSEDAENKPPPGTEDAAKGDDQPPPPEQEGGGEAEATANVQEATASVVDDAGAPMAAAAMDETEATTGGAQGDDMSARVNAAQQGAQYGQAQQAQSDSRQSYERTHQANPLRDLGDALKTWYDRLNVSDPDEAGADEGEKQVDELAPRDDRAEAYSFVREGEQSDAQTLGAATEEQQASTGALPEEEEGGSAGEEEDGEDVRAAQRQEQAEAPGEVLDAESLAKEAAAEPMDTDGPEDEAARRQALQAQQQAEEEDEGAVVGGVDDQRDAIANAAEAEGGAEEPLPVPTEEELAAAREAIEEGWQALHSGDGDGGSEEGAAAALELWLQMEGVTGHLAQTLCEHLRLILEATKMAKMKGDYRTGKRLNMRKIIPYIASQFRKDKIWLRRTRPSKREYQVMVAVDNSESMSVYRSKQLALEAVCVLTTALARLEVGELSVVGFGDAVDVIQPFDSAFSTTAGAAVLERLHFKGTQTRVGHLLATAHGLMREAAQRAGATNLQTHQLLFVVSDSDNIYQEGQSMVGTAGAVICLFDGASCRCCCPAAAPAVGSLHAWCD